MNRYFLLLNENTLEVYLSELLDVEPENSILFFENNFQLPVFDRYPNPTAVIEGMTPEAEKELAIREIKQKYEFHKTNGWEAYQSFRAKIVLDIYSNVITENQAFQIESLLKVAYDRIAQTGDWKTARYELVKLTPPAFILPYFNEAKQIIENYIAENYE